MLSINFRQILWKSTRYAKKNCWLHYGMMLMLIEEFLLFSFACRSGRRLRPHRAVLFLVRWLISRITWLSIGFPCSTVLFSLQLQLLLQFFSVFSFLNRFPLQLFLVPYSYLLLSTNYWFVSRWISLIIIVFSVFRFHKLLVLMR